MRRSVLDTITGEIEIFVKLINGYIGNKRNMYLKKRVRLKLTGLFFKEIEMKRLKVHRDFYCT